MRGHVDAHLSGAVPEQRLQDHGRHRCAVCGLSLSTQFRVHPTCHPEARQAAPTSTTDVDADASGSGLPDITKIQAGATRTLRHVPTAARYLWGRALTRALAEAVRYNNERAWRELLMLPQCTLGTPPRGGRKHHKAAAAYTIDRLHRWLEGDRRSLWDDRARPAPLQRQSLSMAKRREALAREGFDRKACNALVSTDLCPDATATANALHSPDPVVRADTLPMCDDIAPDTVAQALRLPT